MASTTIDLDTELSAVNSILGAIGQAPVTALVYDNPEISFIYNLLRDANVDTQAEGWHFNTEKHVKYTPDTNGNILIANDVLRLDVSEGWTHRVHDVIRLYNFEDLPPVFKRFITYRACRMAATQLVANQQLVQLLGSQEALARAALMEYECNQGNHSMFGFEDDTAYNTYQPWRNLRR